MQWRGGSLWWLAGWGCLACSSAAPVGQPPASLPHPGAAVASEAPPAAPAPGPTAPLDQVTLGAPDQTCSSDDDCVASWRYDCCQDCPPTPPYVSRNAAGDAAARAAVAKECETEDHDCSLASCAPSPPGCRIAAVCREGRCAVLSNAACGEPG